MIENWIAHEATVPPYWYSLVFPYILIVIMLRSCHVVITIIPRWQHWCLTRCCSRPLGIICFYSDSQQNEPVWKNVTGSCKTHNFITTLHLYATVKYCRTQKVCQVKIITNRLFVIINDGDKCVIANLNKQQNNISMNTYIMCFYIIVHYSIYICIYFPLF